jgi:hypothetical protein
LREIRGEMELATKPEPSRSTPVRAAMV